MGNVADGTFDFTRKLERMQENAGAADVVLSQSEVSMIDKALDSKFLLWTVYLKYSKLNLVKNLN